MNIVVWDLNEEAMQTVAKELRAKGATAFTYRVDVSKRERVYEVAKQVRPVPFFGWVGCCGCT